MSGLSYELRIIVNVDIYPLLNGFITSANDKLISTITGDYKLITDYYCPLFIWYKHIKSHYGIYILQNTTNI